MGTTLLDSTLSPTLNTGASCSLVIQNALFPFHCKSTFSSASLRITHLCNKIAVTRIFLLITAIYTILHFTTTSSPSIYPPSQHIHMLLDLLSLNISVVLIFLVTIYYLCTLYNLLPFQTPYQSANTLPYT